MVLCFLVHDVLPISANATTSVTVHFSKFYNGFASDPVLRCERQQYISLLVSQHHRSRPSGNGDGTSGALSITFPEEDSTKFDHIVVYRASLGLLYSLALDAHETVALATNVLSMLCRVLYEHHAPRVQSHPAAASAFNGTTQPSPAAINAAWLDVAFNSRIEETCAVVDTLMPCGLLLMLSGSYVKYLRREAEDVINAK